MSRIVIGIDPGLKGGLARLENRALEAVRMPTLPRVLKNGKTRRTVNFPALALILRGWVGDNPVSDVEVWFEDVHSMPRDGHVGAFTFGRNVGGLEGVLGALGLTPNYVSPQKWQAAVGASSDKQQNILRAQHLFPRYRELITTDGIADATLLALYGNCSG